MIYYPRIMHLSWCVSSFSIRGYFRDVNHIVRRAVRILYGIIAGSHFTIVQRSFNTRVSKESWNMIWRKINEPPTVTKRFKSRANSFREYNGNNYDICRTYAPGSFTREKKPKDIRRQAYNAVTLFVYEYVSGIAKKKKDIISEWRGSVNENTIFTG